MCTVSLSTYCIAEDSKSFCLPSTWRTAGHTESKNETLTQPLVKGKNCMPQTSPAEKRSECSGESVLMGILPNNSKNLSHCCLEHSYNYGSVLHLPVLGACRTQSLLEGKGIMESWGCKVLLSHPFPPLKVLSPYRSQHF